MRYPILLIGSLLLAACAHREKLFVGDRVPFDQRLADFQSLHNRGQIKELRAYFYQERDDSIAFDAARGKLRKVSASAGGGAVHTGFQRTEVVYSLPRRAATRSDVVASAAGRFNLKERVTVDWRVEDGYWRIARILYSDWSPIVGTWRHSGMNREGSIELRVLPGWKLSRFPCGDPSAPAFRGSYRLEGNKIIFVDTSSSDPQKLQSAEGSYLFVRTADGCGFAQGPGREHMAGRTPRGRVGALELARRGKPLDRA